MFASLIFIAAITAANLSIAFFGPASVPINAFLLIGLDLALRDHLHDKWSGNHRFARMTMLILIAGAVSYALNPATGLIAIASVSAFSLAAVADWAVYHLLRNKPYLKRSNASNAVGALVDSIVFPTIAFGGFDPAISLMMFAAKTAGGFVWSLVINARREVAP